MDAPVLTYSFYCDEYGGTADAETFKGEAVFAEAFVSYLVYTSLYAVSLTEEQARVYLMACCAALDVFTQYGHVSAGGFTIGSFRMDAPADATDPQVLAYRAVVPFLVPAGLLFCGVR